MIIALEFSDNTYLVQIRILELILVRFASIIVLKCFSILANIAFANHVKRKVLATKLNLSAKEYYSLVSRLLIAGLITRKNAILPLTALDQGLSKSNRNCSQLVPVSQGTPSSAGRTVIEK